MAGIYVHIPFCKQACFYCDFHFSTSLKNKGAMVDAIKQELILRKSELQDRIGTIYFGGGTPSLLTVEEIQELLKVIETHYTVDREAEITLEANPDDLGLEKIKALSHTKINRLSIGIQSFFDEDLKYMNRAHTAKEAMDSLKHAKDYFDNITTDLIYGIPGMTKERWKQNLEQIFNLKIPHLSCYALTVEEKTALASFIKKGTYLPVNETLAQSHFELLVKECRKNQMIQYEISNFAKSGYFSKHNSAYWKREAYLGIGPSAHSFVDNSRSWNIANNTLYIKALGNNELPSEKELLTNKDIFNEMIMTGLRTIWGLDLEEIAAKFSHEISEMLLRTAQKYIDQGQLKKKGNTLLLTSKAKFFGDGISAGLFMTDDFNI
ncbi:MAG: radical SAM family heme chaperone HemW [Flavobacteriaceae bacterium]|nr:radical SAM family heme chaperone HemW [Flavobacteriaceae bacterium]